MLPSGSLLAISFNSAAPLGAHGSPSGHPLGHTVLAWKHNHHVLCSATGSHSLGERRQVNLGFC